LVLVLWQRLIPDIFLAYRSSNIHTRVDGTIVVNEVTRIDLPGSGGNNQAPGEDALRYFVAGPENRLVTAVLKRLLVGEDLSTAARLFNPLVLTGPTGSGKSHLARGIARRWFPRLDAKQFDGDGFDDRAVAYFTAIDFSRQLHFARSQGELETFRQRLAHLQLLLVENLQQLPQRVFVQREFRDTLDALIETGGLVVITAARVPATMATLEPGLRDRLAAGLHVQLRPPGSEARREILQLAAEASGATINETQLQSLSQQVEGSASRVMRALAEIDLQSATGQNVVATTQKPLKLKQIVAVVARYYGLTQAAMRSTARRKSLVHARAVAVYLARTLTALSYAQIGQGLGRRDHTTIMHAERSIRLLRTTDAATQQALDELQRLLTAV